MSNEINHPHCEFKTELEKERSLFLCETASSLMYAMAEWCQLKGWPFVVTATVSTPEEDRALKRVSDTHRTARAFDVSRKGWTSRMIDEFTAHFEKEWGAMGAIGGIAGISELIVHHDAGEGDHLHVQLLRTFAIKDPLKRGETFNV